MRFNKLACGAAMAAAVCGSWGGSARAASGDISYLGTFGGAQSFGGDINEAGQVTGYATNSAGNPRAFRYTGLPGAGGTMEDLGTLMGMTSSYGAGINAAGQIAGRSETFSTNMRATLYIGTPGAGGMMHDLGTFGGPTSIGMDINNAGQVVGNATLPDNAGSRAFLYTGTPGAGGAMQDLGAFQAVAINESGQIAGHTALFPLSKAVRYVGTPGAGGTTQHLGTLGGTLSLSFDINTSGQVVGFSTLPGGGATAHGFVYTGTPGAGGMMRDIKTLPGGSNSFATAINDLGHIVGNADIGTDPLVKRAILYVGTPDVDGQMINLDTWLDSTNATEGAKWVLTEARGINNSGLISGTGTYNDGPGGLPDGERAFILDASGLLVPEPAGLAALALASVFGMTRRRRR